MPKFPSGGKIRVSLTPPPLNLQKDPIETEVKYYGLIRDEALFDIEEPSKALAEVLRDVQDPAEAATEGIFTQQDIEIIDGVVRYNLKNEDFSILLNASLNVEDDAGATTSLVNPRQRVADRIKQLEFFAGRGTIYQGQGTILFKYIVPTDEEDGSGNVYSHTNPPPFFTEDIDSTIENAPDFVPSTATEIENTHRVGYLEDGIFVPAQEREYWWSGEYNQEGRSRSEYGNISRDSLTDPKYPIVRDGNLSYGGVPIEGISVADNWGLRFDTWFKKDSTRDFGRFAVQVSGHVRIDFFEKTGYDSNGNIQGTWRKALDTTDSSTYFIQESREQIVSRSTFGHARNFIQGGPSVNYAEGTGTKPDYTARAGTGGVMDYTRTYTDMEGNSVSKYDNEYVPVVIRFWYGQKDPSVIDNNSTLEEILNSAPEGPASMIFDHITSSGYEDWNDYSSVVKFAWSSTNNAWTVATGGTETDLTNLNEEFEIYVYKQQAIDPDGGGTFNKDNWDVPISYIGGKRKDGTTDQATFSIPGFSPSDTDPIWVVVRNRPWSGIPYSHDRDELWQRYLFNPSPRGTYRTSEDLLEGGPNYIEPNPAKVSFDENLDYYKSKFGQLPELNTYGPSRYDGMIRTELTSSPGSRDYDYDHSKLLFIGRQKKGTISEIGDGISNPNKVGKDLATNEIREKGENYTFVNVVSDEFGNGGNVIINAYPTNNLGILNAGDTGSYDKALHLADNTKTYSDPLRQNIQNLLLRKLPNTGFDSTAVIKRIDGSDGNIYFYGTSLNGSTFDTTGIISNDTFGATTRNHDVKTAFISGFKVSNGSNTGNEYYFYGLIGAIRPSQDGISLSTNATAANKITSTEIFPDIIGANSYQGTLIEFRSGQTVSAYGYVTSYDPTTQEVTFTLASGSTSANTTYTDVDVWYNFVQVPSLPESIVNSSGGNISSGSVLANNALVQLYFTHSGSYQYSRTDNGAGLSFSETLFFIGDDSLTTAQSPFLSGTEAPAPPAEIVTPFGYDNAITAQDPGLGGLCYPPYNSQSIDLINTIKTTSDLNQEAVGNFDTWWGSRDNLTTLGGNYLEVTDKLIFDFDAAKRSELLDTLSTNEKPDFIGANPTPYSHKLEVELNVDIPTGPTSNPYLYKDIQKYSNNKPVKDRYFLFINKNGSDLEVLTANNPSWT